MSHVNLRRHLEKQPTAVVARLFSTRTLRLLAKKEISGDYRTIFDRLDAVPRISKSARIMDIYQVAFDVLRASERSEYVFKNVIAEKLLYGKHSPKTAALLFEHPAANCKLDALLLNGTSNAFEIKTSLDELKRLPTQIASYQKVFKNVWLVTDSRHLATAKLLLPKEVGIKILSKRYRLETIRPALPCLDLIDQIAILSSLKKSEYRAILKSADRSVDDLPNTRQFEAATAAFLEMDVDWLHGAMVQQLKNRFAETNRDLALNVSAPLAAAALSMNLSKTDAQRFIASLSKNARVLLENL